MKIVADTVWQDARILTFHLQVWKPLLAEINMHSLTSRSAGSSRAVNMTEFRRRASFTPSNFTANQRGMTGKPCSKWQEFAARCLWECAKATAKGFHFLAQHAGIAKQHANRLLEPFAVVDLVWTMEADYFDYLFQLRGGPEAQPEFRDLVLKMRDLIDRSVPVVSQVHAPWGEINPMVCAALCARASYLGAGVRRADDMARGEKLLRDRHMGPFEHWCRAGRGTRKFRNWVQYREEIEVHPIFPAKR